MFNKLNQLFVKKIPTASAAKQRLQIILAHDHEGSPPWMSQLRDELIQVISKYVKINQGDLDINMDKEDSLDVLKINVSLPDQN
jgi:cell division topological specificity factor